MNVVFYQMMATSLEKTLPKLLEKIYEQKQRAVIVFNDAERLKLMDALLWSYSKLSFLPHGSALTHDEFKKRQPIWLTLEIENPNHADVLVITHGFYMDHSHNFNRCLDLFDGQDPEQTSAANTRMGQYQAAGHSCNIWLQKLDGKWEQGVSETSLISV